MRRRSDPHENTAPPAPPVEDAPPQEQAPGAPPVEGDSTAEGDLDAAPPAPPETDDGNEPQGPAPEKPAEDAPRPAPLMAPDRKRPGVLRAPAPKVPEPNRPSFDWVRGDDGQLTPNLRQGEEVTDVFEVGGVEVVRTSCTRFIYLCTAKEYEAQVGELIPREVFKVCFPHAFE